MARMLGRQRILQDQDDREMMIAVLMRIIARCWGCAAFCIAIILYVS
jgi:hypothetical protein